MENLFFGYENARFETIRWNLLKVTISRKNHRKLKFPENIRCFKSKRNQTKVIVNLTHHLPPPLLLPPLPLLPPQTPPQAPPQAPL